MKLLTLALATAAAAAIGSAALADDAPTVAFNFGAGTDYVFRGVSQTGGEAQAFAGVDVGYKSLYAGAWTSNVNFKPFGDFHTDEEVDLYAGWKPTVGPLALDIGTIYYGYLDQPHGVQVDYWEFYGKASHAFGPVTAGAAFYYSPQFTGKTGHAEYYEANLAYAINPKWTVSGAIGRQDIELASDYTTWNAGVTYAITDKISLDARYTDTDQHGWGSPYHSRVLATLKAVFP